MIAWFPTSCSGLDIVTILSIQLVLLLVLKTFPQGIYTKPWTRILFLTTLNEKCFAKQTFFSKNIVLNRGETYQFLAETGLCSC